MQRVFRFDGLGGPVYCARDLASSEATELHKSVDQSYVIAVLVEDQSEAEPTTELREYFALNYAQAVARAAELQVRLRELETPATVTGIRPTSKDELDAFFRAIDRIEEEMPEPVTETELRMRTDTHEEQLDQSQTEGGTR